MKKGETKKHNCNKNKEYITSEINKESKNVLMFYQCSKCGKVWRE